MVLQSEDKRQTQDLCRYLFYQKVYDKSENNESIYNLDFY